jgi:hypothetical protein
LSEWNWNGHDIPESEAVTETVPGHFRMSIGGDVQVDWKDVSAGCDIPVSLPGYSFDKSY